MINFMMAGRIAGRQLASRNLSTKSAKRSLAAALETSSVALTACSSSLTPSVLANNYNFNHCHQLPPSFPTRYFSYAPAIQPEIKLYNYQICPFCNITKSLIMYSKLDYEPVEVNPLTKAELKPWSGKYKKVPIALIDGDQINGSEKILESILDSPHVQKILEKRWASDENNNNKMTMQQFQNSDKAQKWIKFAIDDLAALLYPNICGSLSDSYYAFGYVKNVDTWSGLQKMSIQSLGAVAMYFAAGKVKAKRNITDEKAALKEALDKYEKEGLQNGKLSFSSGLSCPDLGDLAMFGVLYSVRGLAAHDAAIESRGGPIKEWYDRMSEQVLGENE